WLLNGERVVRAPRHGEAARALEREACLLPRIAPLLPVPVPLPELLTGPVTDARPLSIHDRVEGVPLTRDRWSALPEADRAAPARQLGGFLAALHGVDVSAAAGCGLEEMDHRRRARELRRAISSGSGRKLPVPLRESLDEVLREYLAGGAEWSYQPAILHADVSPGHVLVDPERSEVCGVIDWGDAAIGDPARDFVFLYEDWGREFLASAIEAYDPAETKRFLARVHVQYLIDQLAWTLRASGEGREGNLEHAAAALREGVRDLGRSAG
ncbi:MAG: phosphotransferase, partial [Gemmatimonadota bacterium]|nr:phosphotransferase [Gemmatimonadota bacterium]